MKEIELITKGVSAFLQYEFCCLRGNLFGESYLTSAVGNILQSLHGGVNRVVLSGYQHPILSAHMKGGGRRPEVDFVVSTYDDSNASQRARSKGSKLANTLDVNVLTSAVEAKWAGSSHCTVENVLWDLLRLEMLVNANPKITAILLIAGRTDEVNNLQHKQELETLLSFKSGSKKVEFLPTDSSKRSLLAKLLTDKSIQSLELPTVLQVAATMNSVEMKKGKGFSAIAWQVRPATNRMVFRPEDISTYRHVAKPKTKRQGAKS